MCPPSPPSPPLRRADPNRQEPVVAQQDSLRDEAIVSDSASTMTTAIPGVVSSAPPMTKDDRVSSPLARQILDTLPLITDLSVSEPLVDMPSVAVPEVRAKEVPVATAVPDDEHEITAALETNAAVIASEEAASAEVPPRASPLVNPFLAEATPPIVPTPASTRHGIASPPQRDEAQAPVVEAKMPSQALSPGQQVAAGARQAPAFIPMQVYPGAVAPSLSDPHAEFRKGRWKKPALVATAAAAAIFGLVFLLPAEDTTLDAKVDEKKLKRAAIGGSVSPLIMEVPEGAEFKEKRILPAHATEAPSSEKDSSSKVIARQRDFAHSFKSQAK